MAHNMAEDAVFETKVREILHRYPYIMDTAGPTSLLDHLYIGSYNDAYSVDRLKDLRITHVLNCAAFSDSDESPYEDDSGVRVYKQFHADDDDSYHILQHFPEAKEFIDDAKSTGGKALVHCAMGINRSGAICIAYIMLDQNLDLLEVMRRVKEKRGVVLCNRGFQRQLIKFAREKGLLYPNK